MHGAESFKIIAINFSNKTLPGQSSQFTVSNLERAGSIRQTYKYHCHTAPVRKLQACTV